MSLFLTEKAAPTLEVDQISRHFIDGTIKAVDDVSFSVRAGEIVSILGPSGCGKTTTMRMIAGLETPTAGDIRIEGRSVLAVPPHQRKIGFVFQSLAIFPHMSVRENVAFGLRMQAVPRSAIRERVERALDLVQLLPATFAERRPQQLSGGQLQRVALARTLVTEPALVLFDEPMAALDRRLRDHMAVELRSLQKRLNTAAIYVTHDQETASVMSDRIVIMQGGRIMQIGTPEELYLRPVNRFVASFLGEASFLEVQAGEGGADLHIAGTSIPHTSPPVPAGRRLVLVIRPEHVRLSRAPGVDGAIPCRVESAQFISGFTHFALRLADGQQVSARLAGRIGDFPPPGEEGVLELDRSTLHVIHEG